ncbi:MAG TPA: phage terminase small subunit P27 family [Pirellulales bacterium]|jgi:P27 family predicted phage terminase small subunit|nr:phage terminase small subunit P27 family [Pirellulales bacterium]
MRGRKPKPTVLKLLDGNPGKRTINDREPGTLAGVPEPPDGLDDEALLEWNRIVPELREMGVLSRADRAALAAYCTAWGRWRNAEAQVKKHGPIVKSPDKGFPMKSPYLTIADQAVETMRKFLVEFGLTPSSRSRIRISGGNDPASEFDRFTETG